MSNEAKTQLRQLARDRGYGPSTTARLLRAAENAGAAVSAAMGYKLTDFEYVALGDTMVELFA